MAYTIITDICEGAACCVDSCPVACIHPGFGNNAKGIDDWNWIDFASCIDCGLCLQVCPTQGAILSNERPELQKMPMYRSLEIAARKDKLRQFNF